MDYKKIAYGSFCDRDGRVWGVNLFRRTDSVMIARELSLEGTEAAVVEWDEFDLEQPIQGSSLTLRIISEADREWISLYTVKDGDVVAEVTLEGELWWRGSLDPETYEEPYERADNYTVTLRFSDFGPLKRHQFVAHGEGLVKTGISIGMNLLEVGTVTALDESGLPVNIDLSAISAPEGMTVAAMLGTGASAEAFREDADTDDYIKAWDALSALLTASNLRMTQRAGKIVIFNLKGLRDNSAEQSEECVWSSDSQTLSADRIASRVTVSHKGEGESNLVKDLETGRERDVKVIKLDYGYSPHDITYESFSLSLYQTSTWERPEEAWGFFSIRAGLDSVASADGWVMWAYRNNTANSTLATAAGYATYTMPQTGVENPHPVAASPSTYIHLTEGSGVESQPYSSRKSGYAIKVEQEMLFDCRFNPFADDGDGDIMQQTQEKYAKTQLVYVMGYLTVRTAAGKTYWWTNAEKINDADSDTNMRHSFSGRWSEDKMPYWIQYRTKEKNENGQVIGGGWVKNRAFVPVPVDISWKKYSYSIYTQKLPDGDLIPLPPERGWISLEVCAVVRCMGDKINANEALGALRWILGKGARISIVDANGNYEMPESAESEIKVVCNNGAEDPTEISPLLGSGGGYLGCRSIIIDADGHAAEKGVPELATATECASQLCVRRTRLSGEAYINPEGPLTFTERLQKGRIFMLAQERMDLQAACGDRTITELVRTDIEGLEVRRNERVIFEGTADRGGRDGKDAEVFSIVPTVTSVASQYGWRMTEGPLAHQERYIKHIPAEVGCTVFLTVGPDMMKTRDGVLKCRAIGYDGETLTEKTVATDGGVSDTVTVPERCLAMEFRLFDNDTDDAEMIAICTIPVSTDGLIMAEYVDDKLNFSDVNGNKLLDTGIDISPIDEDCGEWDPAGTYRNGLMPDLNTGKRKRSHVWYRGCKYVCLTDLTKNPPAWDSKDWRFEEGNPDLTLQWTGSDSKVYAHDPKLTLEVAASLYNQDITDCPRIRWDWTRESIHDGTQDTASDDLWNNAHRNTGSNMQALAIGDMNYHFGTRPEKLSYTVTATLLDSAGVPMSDASGKPMTEQMIFDL